MYLAWEDQRVSLSALTTESPSIRDSEYSHLYLRLLLASNNRISAAFFFCFTNPPLSKWSGSNESVAIFHHWRGASYLRPLPLIRNLLPIVSPLIVKLSSSIPGSLPVRITLLFIRLPTIDCEVGGGINFLLSSHSRPLIRNQESASSSIIFLLSRVE